MPNQSAHGAKAGHGHGTATAANVHSLVNAFRTGGRLQTEDDIREQSRTQQAELRC